MANSSRYTGRKETVYKNVREMYQFYPFPQWNHEKRLQRLPAELCRYRFLGFEQDMSGTRFLDVGCGTGNRSMMAAKYYGVREFVGLDASSHSLAIAKKVAEEEKFDRFVPVEGSLFEMPFEDESFDVVVSWGVLHHTADPLSGLREMVRVCRPGGCIGVFVYNKYADWRHNKQKDRVGRLAGESLEKRFQVAHQLYGKKSIEEMTPEEIAVFFDQYCHPHKSDHSIGEVLDWFENLRLKYYGSFPPLRLRDTLRCIKYRSDLLREYPIKNEKLNKLVKWAGNLPISGEGSTHYRRPTALHKILWQGIYAWQGRKGQYSNGIALGARKLKNTDSTGFSGKMPRH